MLNHEVSGVKCTSDVNYYHKVREAYQKTLKKGLQAACNGLTTIPVTCASYSDLPCRLVGCG